MLEKSAVQPDRPETDGPPTGGVGAPSKGMIIGPCPPEGRAEALSVLYRRVSPTARPGVIVQLLRQEASGALDLSGIWVAYRRGRLVGAMLTQQLAGRAVAVWPPEVVRCWRAGALASALVRDALASYRARGIRLAQAVVDPDLPNRARTELDRGGLPYVTDLTYLGRPVDDPLPVPSELPKLFWEGFRPERRAAFERILERSYVGSLDMPELGGLRSLDDVMQSHKARGRFDPDRWRIGRLEGREEPSAVLLLLASEGRTWEVSYLGLDPEVRGRGLGRAILAHALAQAGPHADRIELAVDSRNVPAERLYVRCGFSPIDRRGVHLAVLEGG
jgi:mycothiol synthase